jgi:hypothetical protein
VALARNPAFARWARFAQVLERLTQVLLVECAAAWAVLPAPRAEPAGAANAGVEPVTPTTTAAATEAAVRSRNRRRTVVEDVTV